MSASSLQPNQVQEPNAEFAAEFLAQAIHADHNTIVHVLDDVKGMPLPDRVYILERQTEDKIPRYKNVGLWVRELAAFSERVIETTEQNAIMTSLAARLAVLSFEADSDARARIKGRFLGDMHA